MSALTNYQVLDYNGTPAFVVVPYDEFMQLYKARELKNTIPQAVVEAHILKNIPIIKAWREHLGLTQQEVAEKSGMLQSAYARLESQKANPRADTLLHIALAMGLSVEQFDV
jgi:DNA-binding XRE family transcriptional regulator